MNDTQRQFIRAFEDNQKTFGVSQLSTEKIFRLARYCEFVEKHNPVLHLTAPAAPEVFAVRHVLESLFMLRFLPEKARFADVGTGAGLPAIPCLIARSDLRGALVEAKLKKANFLRAASAECQISDRVEIFNRQFEELPTPDADWVCCRALDKFTQKLPRLIKWSGSARFLFFGGDALRAELEKQRVRFSEKLLPLSERRFLFISEKIT